MWMRVALMGLALLMGPAGAFGQEVQGVRPLISVEPGEIQKVLPSGTRLLNETASLEQFLDALEGTPPDWATVYGHGHHDPGHDDRLFNLNRERDAKREGKAALQWRVTFLWPGELSNYDPKGGGFRVAVGPKFSPTRWGVVRFKSENLPANLMAVPDPSQRKKLRRRFEKGERIEITVAMTGRLIPEESIVYDFSHDQEGLGLIMPVVRLERIDYLLVK